MWGCHGSVSTVTKYTANKAKTWNGAYASAATYHKFEGSVGAVMEYTADQMKTGFCGKAIHADQENLWQD